MNRDLSELGRRLRQAGYGVQAEPFDAIVYRFGSKGDPIVQAPNGDSVVIAEYNGLEKPVFGQKVKAKVMRDGRGSGYSFGELLHVYPVEERTRSIREGLGSILKRK